MSPIRFLIVLFYFSLAIVLFAAIGVIVPWVFEGIKHIKHNFQDFHQNIVTYYIAIFASASLDLILKVMDTDSNTRKAKVLGLFLFCLIVCVGTAYVLYLNAYEQTVDVFWYIFFGVVISWGMWWITHYSDDVFDPTLPLGGNANRDLSNG